MNGSKAIVRESDIRSEVVQNQSGTETQNKLIYNEVIIKDRDIYNKCF